MNCLLQAFQEATGLDLVERLGHDGSDILHEDFPRPYCERGFHVQELIQACYPEYTCMYLEAWPKMQHKDRVTEVDLADRFGQLILESDNVILCGKSIKTGNPHAVHNNFGKLSEIWYAVMISRNRNQIILADENSGSTV